MNSRTGVLLVGLLSACPAPSPGVDGGTDAGSAPERYCAGYAEALCSRLVACAIADADQRAACQARARVDCDGFLAPAHASATRVEDGALERCREGLASTPCLRVEEQRYPLCLYAPAVRLPAGGLGERCEQVESCLSGVCSAWVPGTVCGACVAPLALGAPCPLGGCDPREAFCNLAGVCEAYGIDGAACVNRDQCRSRVCNLAGTCGPAARDELCRWQDECPASDFCRGAQFSPFQSPGNCAPRVDAGASCQGQQADSAGGCAPGTWCLDNRCASPDAGAVPEGGECSRAWQCADSAVCAGLLQPFDFGRCTTPQLAGPCVSEREYCPPGARCIVGADGGVCRPLQCLDGPCTRAD